MVATVKAPALVTGGQSNSRILGRTGGQPDPEEWRQGHGFARKESVMGPWVHPKDMAAPKWARARLARGGRRGETGVRTEKPMEAVMGTAQAMTWRSRTRWHFGSCCGRHSRAPAPPSRASRRLAVQARSARRWRPMSAVGVAEAAEPAAVLAAHAVQHNAWVRLVHRAPSFGGRQGLPGNRGGRHATATRPRGHGQSAGIGGVPRDAGVPLPTRRGHRRGDLSAGDARGYRQSGPSGADGVRAALDAEQLREFFLDFIALSIEGRVIADIGARGITLSADIPTVERAHEQLHDFIEGCCRVHLTGLLTGLEALSNRDVEQRSNEIYEAAFSLIADAGEDAQ